MLLLVDYKYSRHFDGIYLHFLNRELLRSVETNLSYYKIIDIIYTILLGTTERLYSSLALIWESSFLNQEILNIFSYLLQKGNLDLVSDRSTVNEFIEAQQIFYKYDHRRYPMYFDKSNKLLFDFKPTLFKNKSTTSYLEGKIFQIVNNSEFDSSSNINFSDYTALRLARNKLNRNLLRRGNRAITLSLFENDNFKSHTKLALGRLLSANHTEHYENYLSADICTGISELIYFDCLSRSYPIYDIGFLKTILFKLGIIQYIKSNKDYIYYLIEERGSSTQRDFIEEIRYLLHAIIFIIHNKYKINNSVKALNRFFFQRELDSLLVNINLFPFKYSFSNLWDLGLQNLLHITSTLNNCDKINEFQEIWKMKGNKIRNNVLLVTANRIETESILNIAKLKYQLSFTRNFFGDHTIYALGPIGGINLFLVQSEAGSIGPSGSALTVNDAISYIKPQSIILVGIAFGLQPEKQKIGDILVSKQMQLYELQKRNENRIKQIISRGDKPPSSPRLLDRFRSGVINWSEIDVHFGLLLSGEKLSNSTTFTKELLDEAPEAIGAEMEGAGLFSVAYKRKIDWIVVKSIVDWGFNKTDSHQKLGAENASKFVLFVISQGGFQN
jgi:nucleoside phosphorylase